MVSPARPKNFRFIKIIIMSIDAAISQLDFDEELFLTKYQNRIESLFAYISDIL